MKKNRCNKKMFTERCIKQKKICTYCEKEKQSHANNGPYQYNEHIKLLRLNKAHYSYQTTHMLHSIKETKKLRS